MTQSESIRFGAIVPKSGFRWVFHNSDGEWIAQDPPEDWSQEIYDAATPEGEPLSDNLAEHYYLATSDLEYLKALADQESEFGALVEAPDLYLKFASGRATPETILKFANQYGLLRFPQNFIHITDDEAAAITTAFQWGFPRSAPTYLAAENAWSWLDTFERVRLNLQNWSELQEAGDVVAMSQYLDDGYNYAMGGSLTYQVRMDPDTGRIESDIIASSLADLLEVQWGMSIAANVQHRQCAECPNWFSVHPGSGRPEKQFCSDACRMRAYRKRKVEGKNNG